jgi:putative transposase
VEFSRRKQLDHRKHFAARFGAVYFVTICCLIRHRNSLCHQSLATTLFATARLYQANARWHLKLFLLMPDHLHLLIGIDAKTALSSVIRDFKRITAKNTGVKWQHNYFDHRVRKDESLAEKADYILNNPVRAGFVTCSEEWPFFVRGDLLGKDDLFR